MHPDEYRTILNNDWQSEIRGGQGLITIIIHLMSESPLLSPLPINNLCGGKPQPLAPSFHFWKHLET